MNLYRTVCKCIERNRVVLKNERRILTEPIKIACSVFT